MNKQREALELALDALDSDNPDIMLRASISIREALAEPEQEPVADSDLYAVWLNGFHSRKPLTDNTLWEMWVESPSDVMRFARAIERAHGIGD